MAIAEASGSRTRRRTDAQRAPRSAATRRGAPVWTRVGLVVGAAVARVVPLPILVALGLNGWLGIPLRIGIVMIYSLGLGLAVDDTIHLVTRFFQERKENPGLSNRECLLRSLRVTGKALIVTSLILSVGCLCYLPSEFRSMRDVGTLLNAVIIAALVCDLFLLPHLIERVFRRKSA